MVLVDSLKALADESRLRLVHILGYGAFNVQELTAILGSSQSTISHHLKLLQSNGIAKTRREGTWIYYSLTNGEQPLPASQLAHWFLERASREEVDEALKAKLAADSRSVAEILNRRRDQSRVFFDSHASQWSELRKSVPDEEALMEEVLQLIPDTTTLLELGCGSGALFERLLPRAGKTIGVDNSAAMLEQARQRLVKYSQQIDLRLGNLEHLPLGDNSVDQVVAYMVMHHIAHPTEALQEAHRVLKPQGELIVADLSQHENEYMRERFSDLWLGFDRNEFQSWTKRSGFEGLQFKTLGEDQSVFLLTCLKHA